MWNVEHRRSSSSNHVLNLKNKKKITFNIRPIFINDRIKNICLPINGPIVIDKIPLQTICIPYAAGSLSRDT